MLCKFVALTDVIRVCSRNIYTTVYESCYTRNCNWQVGSYVRHCNHLDECFVSGKV